MKKLFIAIVMLLFAFNFLIAQEKPKIYNPNDNATLAINKAIAEAKRTNKNVFLQIGGNWCKWCLLFNKFVNENETLKNKLDSNYVVYHLNYSKENDNFALMKKYNFPQRFGFPVFVILNNMGQLIHTQNSALLEDGDGYSEKKVLEFFSQWTPSCFDEKKYKRISK